MVTVLVAADAVGFAGSSLTLLSIFEDSGIIEDFVASLTEAAPGEGLLLIGLGDLVAGLVALFADEASSFEAFLVAERSRT